MNLPEWSWPDVDLADLSVPDLPELPLPPLPELPLPDLPELPGVMAQYAVLLPAVAALLGLVLVRRSSRAAAWLAIGPALLTLVATLVQVSVFWRSARGADTVLSAPTIGSLPFGELEVTLELSVGRLAGLLAVVVALVALVVQVFARWYLWFDPRYRVFAATVSLFTAAMMLVVHSGDLVLTLVGWEVMGWCSFLLIGHHSTRPSANRAAGKALVVTRLADAGFVLGIVALAAGPGSTSIAAVIEHWSVSTGPALTAGAVPDGRGTMLTVAMVLLVIGVAGKSALVPFQDWLPDAMEGPTPASALIHAATMVAAGTVVLAQLFPLLQASGPTRGLLAVLASITMLLAAVLAFGQADLKRLLAWSTVSQVALMLAALTVVPIGLEPDAAVMQLTAHAGFKALLFLAVGWLGVLTGGTAVVQLVSGVQRFRSIRRPMAIGLLALAGIPPFVGFVSKELILASAEDGVGTGVGWSAFLVLSAVGAGAPLTAAYCVRAWLILNRVTAAQALAAEYERAPGVQQIDDFFNEPEVLQDAAGVEEAESAISASARLGITVLSALSLLGGLVALTPLVRLSGQLNLQLLAVSLLLMAAAGIAVWGASRGVRSHDAAARLPAGLSLAMERGLGMDRLYLAAVVRPVLALARAVTWADREVLDGYVRAAGHGSRLLGTAGDRWQPVRPTTGLTLVLLGVLLLGALTAWAVVTG